MDLRMLEFCEKSYIHSDIFPQIFSAIGHFPIIPLYQIIYEKDYNLYIFILILLQLITMLGHLIPNPYDLYIPQLSSVLIIYWLFLFIINTTSGVNTINNTVCLGLTIISFLFFMWLVDLYFTIFLHFFLFCIFLKSTNICNLLSYRNRIFLFILFFFSFIVLGLEIIFCESLINYNSFIPWHLCFDILFWQVTCNCLLFSYNKLYFKTDNKLL